MNISIEDRGFITHGLFNRDQDIRARHDQIEYANQVAAIIWKKLDSKLQRTIKEVNFRFFLVGGHSGNPHSPETIYTPEYFELEVRAELMIHGIGSTENLEAVIRLALKDGWPNQKSRKKTADEAVNVFMAKIRETLTQYQKSITRYADNLGVLAVPDQPPA